MYSLFRFKVYVEMHDTEWDPYSVWGSSDLHEVLQHVPFGVKPRALKAGSIGFADWKAVALT